MSQNNLRAELGVPTVPDFDVNLPPGWSRRPVDQASHDEMLSGLRQRLMKEHNLQAYTELKVMVDQSFQAMRSEGAFAFFSATQEEESTLWIPASIIASVRRAEPGETLDDLVRMLIQEHGATPLREDKRTLRFERERTARLGGVTVINQSVVYLTPMPGTGRRRALQLVAGFGRTVDTAPDDPAILAMKDLFDTCVSTLRWRTLSDS